MSVIFSLILIDFFFTRIVQWLCKKSCQPFNIFLIHFFNYNFFIYINCFWLDFIFHFIPNCLILTAFLLNLDSALLIAIFFKFFLDLFVFLQFYYSAFLFMKFLCQVWCSILLIVIFLIIIFFNFISKHLISFKFSLNI